MQLPDFRGALVGIPNERPPFRQVFVSRRQLRPPPPVVVQPLIDLAAHRELPPPGVHIQRPVQRVARIPMRLLLRFRHIKIAEKWHLRRRNRAARRPRHPQKAVQQRHRVHRVQHHPDNQPPPRRGYEVQRFGAARGRHIHRRMGPLQRRRHQVDAVRGMVFARPGQVGRRPEGFHHRNGLPVARLALGVVNAEAGVLRTGRPPPEAHIQPSVAQHIQRGRILRQPHRVMQGRYQHRRA